MAQRVIYHLTDQPRSEISGRDYEADSLTTEGFIHCANRDQLQGVFERYFANCEPQSLSILMIHTQQLRPKLVDENTTGGEEQFPHVYGPINTEAIHAIIGLKLDEFGKIVGLDAKED